MSDHHTESFTEPSAEPAPTPSPLAWVLLLPIRLYRVAIGPLLPPSCRFYPGCSAYAVEALTRHGAFRGLYLTVRRLLRCGPWHPGGFDFVPDRFSFRVQPDMRNPPDDPDLDSSTQELP